MGSGAGRFRAKLLHPRHWSSWCLFAVWWLISMLPYAWLMRLGHGLGMTLFAFNSRRKRIARRNIELCFPTLDGSQSEQLLRANFSSMGMAVMEVGIAWWWPKKRFQKLLDIRDIQYLEDSNGRGTLLLGIHYTTLEIGTAAVTTVYDRVDGMYRAHGNPVYDFLQARGRVNKSIGDTQTYERRDVRGSLTALRRGRTLWFGPDQDYGLGSGLFAPFFGIAAATVDTTARFAKSGNARVVPFTHIRLPKNKGYQITFYPPLENFPTGDILADATTINGLIEQHILLQPEQYLWAHRRFKNRPAGEADLYNLDQPEPK